MAKIRKLMMAPIAASMLALVTPTSANTLTYQGVTFETVASGSTLTLSIANALSGGTGNWANIQYLKGFEIKDIGSVTGASLAGWTADVDHGLSANSGCTTGGTSGACFYKTSAVPLTDSMIFTISFLGSNLDFSAPHLKVQFLANQSDGKATGDLLSQPVSAIPEPEIYATLAVGLGLMGWVARRKRSKPSVLA